MDVLLSIVYVLSISIVIIIMFSFKYIYRSYQAAKIYKKFNPYNIDKYSQEEIINIIKNNIRNIHCAETCLYLTFLLEPFHIYFLKYFGSVIKHYKLSSEYINYVVLYSKFVNKIGIQSWKKIVGEIASYIPLNVLIELNTKSDNQSLNQYLVLKNFNDEMIKHGTTKNENPTIRESHYHKLYALINLKKVFYLIKRINNIRYINSMYNNKRIDALINAIGYKKKLIFICIKGV